MISRIRFIYLIFGICTKCVAQIAVSYENVFSGVFNLQTLTPSEVRWCLYATDIGANKRVPSWRFTEVSLSDSVLVTHGDYDRTGYDRGHMCPAQDRSDNLERMRRTFTMANVCPQTPGLNRGVWKATEIAERRLAMKHGKCRVIAMPLYLEKDTIRIGANGVSVPHAFLKVIYDVNPDTLYNIFFVWQKK